MGILSYGLGVFIVFIGWLLLIVMVLLFFNSQNIPLLQENQFPSETYRRQLRQLQRLRQIVNESEETESDYPRNTLCNLNLRNKLSVFE